ncbi:hypothetical protein H477_0337 [[Clostridium] sordellii ATCC 9714]|nr:hypothetical protein H477_0337 [[Clostridium] sordellii ATCC 9714] [Paeniclostridium sordellii ATCC 9714]
MEVFLNNKYTFDEKYEAKSNESHKEEINRENENKKNKDKVDISVKEQKDIKENEKIKENEVISIELTDKEIVKNFKEEIYDIERQALVPMRECMPDLKNLKVNLQTIKDAKKMFRMLKVCVKKL